MHSSHASTGCDMFFTYWILVNPSPGGALPLRGISTYLFLPRSIVTMPSRGAWFCFHDIATVQNMYQYWPELHMSEAGVLNSITWSHCKYVTYNYDNYDCHRALWSNERSMPFQEVHVTLSLNPLIFASYFLPLVYYYDTSTLSTNIAFNPQ